MAIPFTFDEANHLYKVPGHYVLSTSDVLQINGLSDYGQVPERVLENARQRGTRVDKAIYFFEDGDLDERSIPASVEPYFDAYMAWRATNDFELFGKAQHAVVYEHDGTGQLIGCTIDLRGTLKGKPYIVDIKATYPNSGAAKKQTHFRWRMQLQSYYEATMEDEEFWRLTTDNQPIGRAVLHLQKKPQDKKVIAALCDFQMDDTMLWDSCVRLAQAKLANGWKRNEKNAAVSEEKSLVPELTAMNDAAYIQSLMDDVAGDPVIP